MDIEWDGFHNIRDLGGLPTASGGVTRHGALVRSADPRFATAAGWRAAHDAGVRTVIDLRNEDEIYARAGPSSAGQFPAPPTAPATPAGMRWSHVPLEDPEDVAFWQPLNDAGLNATPLYYGPFLRAKPDRCAAVVTTIARAEPGGVLFHCGAGRDRTGLVTLVVLALAGVSAHDIATDYERTTKPLKALCAAMGRDDDSAVVAGILAARGTTARDAIVELMAGFDAEAYLLGAGVTSADLAALRARVVEDPVTGRRGRRPPGTRRRSSG